jgi:serine/threonine-protein kinase
MTAIVIKHVNDPPPLPRILNPKISRAVESVVLRALEKRRDARPQTAGEMARELIAAAGKARIKRSRRRGTLTGAASRL